MTVYTYDQLDFYIDDDDVSAFVDDNGEDVILINGEDVSAFFGFLRMALWS
jgi:hypothetical protein